jgi:hypothetical protein
MYFHAPIGPSGLPASENHGLIAIEKDPVFDVPADGAGKDHLLQVAALADEIFHGIAVGDADDILLDDGTVVENFGDVMAGGADQLDAALESLMVRAPTDEGWQK